VANSDSGTFFSDAASGGLGKLGRLALVVEDSGMSMAAARLRQLVPTVCVSSLGEIVEALAAHELGSLPPADEGQDRDARSAGLLIGLDISTIPHDQVELFAGNLLYSRASGTVYVMTPAQFGLFDPGLFDYVVR